MRFRAAAAAIIIGRSHNLSVRTIETLYVEPLVYHERLGELDHSVSRLFVVSKFKTLLFSCRHAGSRYYCRTHGVVER
jgi:hypothetical protein